MNSLIFLVLAILMGGVVFSFYCAAWNKNPGNHQVNWLGLGMFLWAVKATISLFTGVGL